MHQLGLLGTKLSTKFIPGVYLLNSADVRLAILQGLLDPDGTVFFHLSRRAPRIIKALIRKGVKRRLPRPDYSVDTHFKPRYDPWDQRQCLVPDGDLFSGDPTR